MSILKHACAAAFIGLTFAASTAAADNGTPFTDEEIQTLRAKNALAVCNAYEPEEDDDEYGDKRLETCEARAGASWIETSEAYREIRNKHQAGHLFRDSFPLRQYSDRIFTPLSEMTDEERILHSKILTMEFCYHTNSSIAQDAATEQMFREAEESSPLTDTWWDETWDNLKPDYAAIRNECITDHGLVDERTLNEGRAQLEVKYGREVILNLGKM